jgi:hypothetical protein
LLQTYECQQTMLIVLLEKMNFCQAQRTFTVIKDGELGSDGL